tara:strand:+ start:5980 stop:8364 length:2385 start_codon:yes stop_codon:yes gene_type:complete
MTKTNSKRTRKGTVGNRGNVSKKYKLSSKQTQIRKHVLKGGNPLDVIEFTNKKGIFEISKSTHPYGYIPEGNDEKTRTFSIQSDIWSFGCLIIELFTLTNIAYIIHDNVLQTLLKSIIYTDNRKAKRNMDDLKTKASRERFEKFVEKFDEKFFNRGAAKDNPTFIKVIKLLVTCIFANSVINFENNIFGFDKIIKYLKKMINNKIQLDVITSKNDIKNNNNYWYNFIIKELEDDLEKLFSNTNSKQESPQIPYLNNSIYNNVLEVLYNQQLPELKGNLKTYFVQKSVKEHLEGNKLDTAIDNLFNVIEKKAGKDINKTKKIIYTLFKGFYPDERPAFFDTKEGNLDNLYSNLDLMYDFLNKKNKQNAYLLTQKAESILKTERIYDSLVNSNCEGAFKEIMSLVKTSQEWTRLNNTLSEDKTANTENDWSKFKNLLTELRKEDDKTKNTSDINSGISSNNGEIDLGGGGMIQKVFEEIKKNFKKVNKNNIEKIGEGGFGEVYTFPFYTRKMAFKTLKSNRQSNIQSNRQSDTQNNNNSLQHKLEFYNECLVTSRLSRLPSDKFPFYYGFAPQNEKNFKFTKGKITNNDPKLFMDYFGKKSRDLGTFLKGKTNANKPKEKHLINYLIQIAEGMKDLHKMGILHLDLAAKNILIIPKNKEAKDTEDFNEYKIKIIDFGKSKLLNVTNSSSQNQQKQLEKKNKEKVNVTNLLSKNETEQEVKKIINDSYKNNELQNKEKLEEKIEKLFEAESHEFKVSTETGGSRNNSTKKSRKSRKSKKTKKRVKHNSTKKTHKKKS